MESSLDGGPGGLVAGGLIAGDLVPGGLVAAVLAAVYGLVVGLLARRRLAAGTHRRYADERARPLPTYRLLPAVIAGVAALFAARLAPAGTAVAAAYVAILPLYAVLTAIDLDVHRLPDALTLPAYPAVAVVLLPAALGPGGGSEPVRRAALAGVATLATFAILHLLSRGQLGLGDVKLSGSLGALLGWFGWDRVLGGVYAMFLVGGAAALWLIVRRRAGRSSRLAFGPAMVIGWAVTVVAGGLAPF